MSTHPDPYRDDPRAAEPLSAHERAVLDGIAGHERTGDPGFAEQLEAALPDPEEVRARQEVLARARRRDRAIQIAVVAGLAALLLPAAWVVAAVITAILLLLPLLLVAEAWRESKNPPDRRSGPSTPAGP